MNDQIDNFWTMIEFESHISVQNKMFLKVSSSSDIQKTEFIEMRIDHHDFFKQLSNWAIEQLSISHMEEHWSGHQTSSMDELFILFCESISVDINSDDFKSQTMINQDNVINNFLLLGENSFLFILFFIKSDCRKDHHHSEKGLNSCFNDRQCNSSSWIRLSEDSNRKLVRTDVDLPDNESLREVQNPDSLFCKTSNSTINRVIAS